MSGLSGLLGALAAMIICVGCASTQGGERDVFPASEGTNSVNPSHTNEIDDIGLQLLQNLTKSPIKLRSIALVSLVAAFTVTKPGRYYLGKVRIDYTIDGHDGWQYQDIDTTMVIKNPPDPGPTPLPRSAVCDLAGRRRGCPGAERA